jgi:cytochrome d ubiquinol oxidase subunit II
VTGWLFAGLTGRALPVCVLSAVAGLASIMVLVAGRFLLARVCAAVAVAALLWGWALGQYPLLLLPDRSVDQAAAQPTVLRVLLVVTAIGAVFLLPSLLWLYAIFQRTGEEKTVS